MDDPWEPYAAFNVVPLTGALSEAGYRVYLTRERLYFIAVGNLDRLSGNDDLQEFGGGFSLDRFFTRLFTVWLPSLIPGRSPPVNSRHVLREAEQRPLEERLQENAGSAMLPTAAITASVLLPNDSGNSLWRRYYGTWAFQGEPLGKVSVAFHAKIDQMIAMKHLPELLGDRLAIQYR
ncbi:MAG: hypothetical protein NZ700_08660 [Gemmataceae bacterium]|nr:hypothetical protein [Gemmataceae bacterium]MDW8266357.1 hypothetical protein [Gemmataceae bacterium]